MVGLDGYEVSDLKEQKYSEEVYAKGKGVKKNNYNAYKKGRTVFPCCIYLHHKAYYC